MARAIPLGLLAAALVGCEATDLPEPPDLQPIRRQVQQAVEDVQTAVAPRTVVDLQARMAGSQADETAQPLRATICHADFVPAAGGFPGAIILATAESPETETYPSLFLQAETSASQLGQLTGATLDAEVWARWSAEGPIWRTQWAAPARILVQSAGPKLVVRLEAAELISDEGQRRSLAGQIEAGLRAPSNASAEGG